MGSRLDYSISPKEIVLGGGIVGGVCDTDSHSARWPGYWNHTGGKGEGIRVSEHLLCADQHAKPETHVVLLKDHNDPGRHGFIPTLKMGNTEAQHRDPSAGR